MAKVKIKPSEVRNKKSNKKNSVRLFFGLGIFLIAILVFLILSNIGVFQSSKNIVDFPIEDKCALIMGNLIHQVRDDGECKIKCINECKIRKLEFDRADFMLQNSSCNDCDCYCLK